MKRGCITSIFKKGDARHLDNYRPVSTLPIFSKIYEKLLYNRFTLYSLFVANNNIYNKQLFLIFINDITTCVLTSTIRCFAVDTRVCKAVSSCQDFSELHKDLENIITWPDRNNTILHEDKFEYICQQANRSNVLLQIPFTSTYFQYHTLGGITLHPANNIRDLGVYISDDLSRTLHIATMCCKARKMAALVFSVFSTRRTDMLMILNKSLLRCHLEYCSPLWNPSKISDLHYWERLEKLSLLSLQMRERYIAIHMWKIRHGLTSNDLQITFLDNNRHGKTAKVPPLQRGCKMRHRSLLENSFAIMGPRIWNCIPGHIRKWDPLDLFKRHLTTFMPKVPDKPPIQRYSSPNSNSILDLRNEKEVSTNTFSGG